MILQLNQRMRRFGRAKTGAAAMEFALILPMMVFLLFGSIDLLDVLGANSRAQNAAASLADVVARDTEVSDEEVSGLWDALDILIYPNDVAGLDMRVTSVRIVDATTAQVVWSEGHGMSPLVANDPVTLPSGMMTPGTSVIMAESAYEYHSPLGFLLSGPVQMTHSAYRRSRLVDPIPRVS
jgi:Flp pilus assembly protein TadG